MYTAIVEINNHVYGMPVLANKQITLPESIETEDEAVKYLTERRYTRFTLYELRTIGTYAPQDAPVVRVS